MSDSLGRKGISVELDKILDAMDKEVDVDHAGQLRVDDTLEAIPFTQWESLAYDLALGTAPLNHIAAGYGVDVIQLQELMGNEHFNQLLTAKKSEVSKLGDGAAFTVGFRMMANRGMQSFLTRLTSAQTGDREFLGLFKQAVELAQLKPVEDPDGGSGNITIGAPSVTFNITGIPGLEHLNSQATTVNATPPKTEEYEDAEIVDDYDDEPAIKLLERW